MSLSGHRVAVDDEIAALRWLGLLIGDSRLNYRRERIFETYYAFALNKALTLTANYQLITYNADRGPVHVFSGRFRGEFQIVAQSPSSSLRKQGPIATDVCC